ncbi:hypothetical protein P7K49_027984, partial [Saguinus oedipus]
ATPNGELPMEEEACTLAKDPSPSFASLSQLNFSHQWILLCLVDEVSQQGESDCLTSQQLTLSEKRSRYTQPEVWA